MTGDPRTSGRTVLVGFDGSDDAVAAIRAGVLLFPDAMATIGHVWSPPFAAHPSPELLRRAGSVDGLIELLNEQGQARADEVTREGVDLGVAAGWDARPLSRRAFAGEGLELARMAEEVGPDVLIVGARGLSGVRAVLGSVSDAVVHYSPVPVLVVPPIEPDRSGDTAAGPVLVGYDGSRGAERALAAARALWPARPHVAASAGSDGVAELATGRDLETAVLARHGVAESGRAVADALAEHAAAIGAAVIVVGSRGRSAHREILLGSVAMATLHHAHRPVLAVPPPNRLALTGAFEQAAGAVPTHTR